MRPWVMRALRVAFVVQGEGRGHMTQALALRALLADAGHEVAEVLVGRSPHRPIPGYFTAGMDASVHAFDAPVQVPDRQGRGLSARGTLLDVVRRSPSFLRSVVTIAERTRDADVVVNFLDLLGGISRTLFPPEVPALAIAHNHLFLHPRLEDAPGPASLRRMVLAYARATAAGTERKMALSFEPLPSRPELGLEVAPPLLRPGLDDLAVTDDGYLLAYALNPGYADILAAWQGRHPDVVVHCYVERGDTLAGEASRPGFHAHELDDDAFLRHLAGCRAYVGSAGFESLCEAYYLGKPVLAVPTAGQFEQSLNAWDASRCGAARWGGYDDLDDFWRHPDPPTSDEREDFRAWVARSPDLFVEAVERTARA